ncbi:Mss4-like protein [Nemania serpens]|nr:Mss4-like protein [Nemania serpens]
MATAPDEDKDKDKPRPLTVRCQCGRVSFPAAAGAAPLTIYHCHCAECRRQSGSAFGTSAIFAAADVLPSPLLAAEATAAAAAAGTAATGLRKYTRDTESGNTMDCYFCGECGSRLFHRVVGGDGVPRPTVSVKGGCVEGLEWKGGKHIYVRSAVMEIPAEWEAYETLPPEMK